MTPQFQIASIGNDCYAINDHGRTVAYVTSQGYIDWLLRSLMENGPLLTSIRKETHLSYTLGLKIQLCPPTPGTGLTKFTHRLENGGAQLVLTGEGASGDGKFTSVTTAMLTTDATASRYEWRLVTTITNQSAEPAKFTHVEYNNVYPGKTGRCFLFAPDKEYNCTLMVDRDGVVWRCPHQHLFHYHNKIQALQFTEGALAGFFGEKTGSPVVILNRSPFPPDWGICDMYYDLHCCARLDRDIRPGEALRFEYEVKYLNQADSEKLLAASRPVPITDTDHQKVDVPRLDLGLNQFDRPVMIDRADDASGFRVKPPVMVWDREAHALRITNTEAKETVWPAVPPTQIPSETKLCVRGKMKTQNVTGKGAYVRLRYHTFVWRPTPTIEWPLTLESVPVKGTSDGWVKFAVPILTVPTEHFDYLLWFDFILDGQGVAWLTDLDVDLQPYVPSKPSLEEGSSKQSRPAKSPRRAVAGNVA